MLFSHIFADLAGFLNREPWLNFIRKTLLASPFPPPLSSLPRQFKNSCSSYILFFGIRRWSHFFFIFLRTLLLVAISRWNSSDFFVYEYDLYGSFNPRHHGKTSNWKSRSILYKMCSFDVTIAEGHEISDRHRHSNGQKDHENNGQQGRNFCLYF